MGRYSPSVALRAPGPLDFTPLTDALADIQERRLQAAQRARQARLDDEDRRRYDAGVDRDTEQRKNDIIEQGGESLHTMDLAPKVRPSVMREREYQSMDGTHFAALESRIPKTGAVTAEHLGQFVQYVNGEPFVVSPLQKAMEQQRMNDAVHAPKETALGEQIKQMFSGDPSLGPIVKSMGPRQLAQIGVERFIDYRDRITPPVRRPPSYSFQKDPNGTLYGVNPETLETRPVQAPGGKPFRTYVPRSGSTADTASGGDRFARVKYIRERMPAAMKPNEFGESLTPSQAAEKLGAMFDAAEGRPPAPAGPGVSMFRGGAAPVEAAAIPRGSTGSALRPPAPAGRVAAPAAAPPDGQDDEDADGEASAWQAVEQDYRAQGLSEEDIAAQRTYRRPRR